MTNPVITLMKQHGITWPEFNEWLDDGGYDQSYADVWDSKCLAALESMIAEQEYERSREQHGTH